MGVPFHEVRQWSAAEISLYMAYYREEPFGFARDDIHNAMGLHQVAEMHRDKKTRSEPFTLKDFWPFSKGSSSPLQARMKKAFQRIR